MIGFIALICMIAPIWMSVYKGRYWCGHYCPRGNLYDRVITKISLNRRIPRLFSSVYFRAFMVLFIFAMFGAQMYLGWGDWRAMGKVFWNIIFVTTVVGIAFGILFAPRAWCRFCPMGTLSADFAPKRSKSGFKQIYLSSNCVRCGRCEKECSMQLKPYEANLQNMVFHYDCLKCGRCVEKCPKQSLTLK